MAFSTQDGKKKFGSGFKAKRYDEFHKGSESEEQTGQPKVQSFAKKGVEPKAESRTEETGESKKVQPSVNSTSVTKGMNLGNDAPNVGENKEESRTDEGGESNENPAEVVAEHGKPHTVTVHHDHAAGKHTVLSHHASGHMHQASFPTPEAAHEHAKQLGASEGGNSEAENEQGGDNANLGDLSSIFGGE